MPRDEGEAHGRNSREAGGEVTAVRHDGIIHDFVMLNALAGTNAARDAVTQAFGEQRETRVGDEIFEAGNSEPVLVVVLAGRFDIVDRTDGTDHRITDAGPGQCAGELGLLTGQTVYASCVVREAGEV